MKESRKEYLKAYMKKYRQEKKEYYKEYNKEYRLKNKEYYKEYLKNYTESEKDGLWRVYLLEDYNYVGYTNCIPRRFRQHKHDSNKDCTNHRILYKTENKEDALELEALLHDLGYEGRNEYFK